MNLSKKNKKRIIELVKNKINNTELDKFKDKSDSGYNILLLLFIENDVEYIISLTQCKNCFYVSFTSRKNNYLLDKKITFLNNYDFYCKLKRLFSKFINEKECKEIEKLPLTMKRRLKLNKIK